MYIQIIHNKNIQPPYYLYNKAIIYSSIMSNQKGIATKSPRLTHMDSKNKSQYENYEEDLNNYRRRNRSDLEQWNLMESNISNSSPNKGNQKQHKTNNNEHLTQNTRINQNQNRQTQSYHQSDDEDDNEDPEQYRRYKSQIGTFSFKVHKDFHNSYESTIKNQQISDQIKKMRQLLMQLNTEVSSKLNKYQMAVFQSKGIITSNQPQRQLQLFSARLELNTKILQSQTKQIQTLIKRDKQLEERDFLIELEEKSNILLKDIHTKKKQKYIQGVAVDKLDSKLIQLRQRDQALQMQEQVRIVKIVKHQVLYYFKKFHENKSICDQLDKQIEQLTAKDQQIALKYNKYALHANNNNLLVKANPIYTEGKKMQDQLKNKAQKAKKNIQVTQFSAQTNEEMSVKQIDKLKKQIDRIQKRTSQANQISIQLAEKADKLIDKHKIGEKLIMSLPYKFAETLMKDSQLKLHKDAKQKQQKSSGNHAKQKFYIKPNLNRNKHKKNDMSLDSSLQASSRYRTVQHHDILTPRNEEHRRKNSQINDKNLQTISLQSDTKVPMRPNLRIKKIKGDKSPNFSKRSNGTDGEQLKIDSSKVIDMQYKHTRLNKLKQSQSKKKQVPAGPLSDDYMKSLQKKGMQNLSGI